MKISVPSLLMDMVQGRRRLRFGTAFQVCCRASFVERNLLGAPQAVLPGPRTRHELQERSRGSTARSAWIRYFHLGSTRT